MQESSLSVNKKIFGVISLILNYNLVNISCLRDNWVKILKKSLRNSKKSIKWLSILGIQQDNPTNQPLD